MKVVIVGAGKLGLKVANTLLGGDHDVTIIDTNEDILQKISSQMDVMTINANAKEIKVLKRINIASYDFMITTTGDDEENIVISAFAKSLGCKKAIARVRDPEHMQQISFIKEIMGIDHIVNPDLGITVEIYKYLAEKYTPVSYTHLDVYKRQQHSSCIPLLLQSALMSACIDSYSHAADYGDASLSQGLPKRIGSAPSILVRFSRSHDGNTFFL